MVQSSSSSGLGEPAFPHVCLCPTNWPAQAFLDTTHIRIDRPVWRYTKLSCPQRTVQNLSGARQLHHDNQDVTESQESETQAVGCCWIGLSGHPSESLLLLVEGMTA
jgi:hypothetical protein